MKKLTILILSLCLSVFLWGCSRKPVAEVTVPAPSATQGATQAPLPVQTTPSTAVTEPEAPDAFSAYETVLNGSCSFVDVSTGEALDISHIGELLVPADIPTHVVLLSAVDMDQDAAQEVVLQIGTESDDYVGFVLLRHQDGTVYGQGFYYRPFQDLKADGSYRFSGSSSDHGYGRKQFIDGQWAETKLAECYASVSGDGIETMAYFVGGEYVNEEKFAEFEARQQEKPDAVWYGSWDSLLAAQIQ